MPTVLQLRRGTTAQHTSFTGAEGEVTVNTSKDTLVVHDGSTQGGFEIALADLSNTSAIELTDLSGGTGVTYNNSTGAIAIGQAVGTGDSVTFAGVTAPLTGNVTGNVDGIVGGTTPAAGTFTTVNTSGALTVGGNLTVNGTTTTINSTTLTIDDKEVVLASGAANAAAANGAGISVDGASATFNYASTGDKWTMNKPLDMGANSITTSGGVTADVTGDLTGNSAGVHTGNVTGNLTGNVTGNVTGDVTGSISGGTVAGSTATFSSTGSFGGNVTVTGSVLPQANVTYDLGSSSLRWRDLYLSGNTLDLGGQTISVSGSAFEMSQLSVTSTLNIDGVGLTAVQTSAESFSDNDTSVMTSAAANDRFRIDIYNESGTLLN